MQSDDVPNASKAVAKHYYTVNCYSNAEQTDVREIDGLWLTGDTTRSRGVGIDKAARAGITTTEGVLGTRLSYFDDTVRY